MQQIYVVKVVTLTLGDFADVEKLVVTMNCMKSAEAIVPRKNSGRAEQS